MNIYGLQKMTLLDYPEHIACTVFLNGCDFKCPFCHNYELVDGTAKPVMTENDLFDFLKTRKVFLDGVAITGGEPCLNPKLPYLLDEIHKLGFKTKLDTNGYHPELLSKLINSGLVDYVAMDIKNSEEKYADTCGIDSVDMSIIKSSISILMQNKVPYEFRTTVINEFHEESDFESIGKMIENCDKYFLQRFTDRDTVPYGNLTAPSFESMYKYKEKAEKYIDRVFLRGVE